MQTSFHRVYTSDKLELQGLLYEPDKKTKRAVLHVHGMAGSFYENKFLDFIAKKLTPKGWAFCAFNNRGTGFISDFFKKTKKPEEYVGIGNSREKFEDCLIDIKAWVDFLSKQGFNKIHLQGHSLGSVKVPYYQAKTQDKRIKSLVLLSPPDMIGLIKEDKKKYEKDLNQAKQMVKQGKGNEFMPERIWDWYLLSANTCLNFFAEGSEVAVLNFHNPQDEFKILSQVKVPIFAVMGTKDDALVTSIEKTMRLIKEKAKSSPRVETKIIKGALHSYRGHEQQLADAVYSWLKTFPK